MFVTELSINCSPLLKNNNIFQIYNDVINDDFAYTAIYNNYYLIRNPTWASTSLKIKAGILHYMLKISYIK